MVQRGKGTAEAGALDAVAQSRQEDPPQGRLSIRKWFDLASRLPGQLALESVNGLDTRRFIEAVLWVAATDSTWSQLPKSYGNFHVVHQRFERWARLDAWDGVCTCLQSDPRLPGLQRLVRQQRDIQARRKQRAGQAPAKEADPTVGLTERIHELEARVARTEKLLRIVLETFPKPAGPR